MADAVDEHGYPATTIAHVVARAGVSRKTFYAYFKDKEECFLAAYLMGVEILIGAAGVAAEGIEDWRERLRVRVETFLDGLASEPAFARAFTIEVMAAGPRALEARREVNRLIGAVYRDIHTAAREADPDVAALPDDAFTAIVGGASELVADRVLDGRATELGELAPVLHAYLVTNLAPPKRH